VKPGEQELSVEAQLFTWPTNMRSFFASIGEALAEKIQGHSTLHEFNDRVTSLCADYRNTIQSTTPR